MANGQRIETGIRNQRAYLLSRRSHEPAYERLRLRLKETRVEAGLTQAEVGRPESFISKLETRERRVDFVEIQVLAKIYGRPLSHYADESVTERFKTARH